VSGLTKTDEEWSAELEAALTAVRRDDLKHGTNAAYVAGCVLQRVSDPSAQPYGQAQGWPTVDETWVVIKGSRRVALRRANVEAVHEKKDGGSILRVVSGQEYEVTEYIDDVLDAVDGSNIVPLTASP
jgi:hypothetical protein